VVQGRDSGSAPYFFLGYAHTPENLWVEKLYRELCCEVFERTTLSVSSPAGVGFMDRSFISPGGDWREEIARALATCKVFVPLYSPRYFTREECGREWHAFAQRIIDHRARRPGDPSDVIVPALWTPVDLERIPEVAQRIQMNHVDLGVDYAREGFYTLIKNNLYRQEYITAVQRLAQHIIRAAETACLQPCRVEDFGQPRNVFDTGNKAPADRRLNIIVAAPTEDHFPEGRSANFYGRSSKDWNPYHPLSRQAIAEYTVGVARLNSYEPTVLTFDEGCELVEERDPSSGLGLLILDAWVGVDESLARRLVQLDAPGVDWIGTMVPWNMADPQTRANADTLRARLRRLLPNRLGAARPVTAVNSTRISTLEEFRSKLPEVLEQALLRYINYAEAHPPAGRVPPRPLLSGFDDPYEGRTEAGEGDIE
jgi:FxsC-like protein